MDTKIEGGTDYAQNMLTEGEVLRIQNILNEIEKCLGHPISGGIIDVSTLKDHILTGGEVLRITNNIRKIEKRANVSKLDSAQMSQIFDECGNVSWFGGYISPAIIFE